MAQYKGSWRNLPHRAWAALSYTTPRTQREEVKEGCTPTIRKWIIWRLILRGRSQKQSNL